MASNAFLLDATYRHQLREALEWIASVNACDHEYQSKARAALKATEDES